MRLLMLIGPIAQVSYKYVAQNLDGKVTALDDYDCALVLRNKDSLTWWDGKGTAAANNGANCP